MMSISSKRTLGKSTVTFYIFIILAFIVGTVLRLYMITEQILLDDEWHGIYYVTGKSLAYLFTHFSTPGDTCIPLNLYRWFLLKNFYWSETILRLPSLVAGILALVVLPLLIKKIVNLRVTVGFAFLLAVSPFMTFYSRVSRPYSIVALLGFLSILSIYFWATGGQRKYAVIYVLASFITIYFHYFEVFVVLSPLGYLFVRKVINRLDGSASNQVRIVPSLLEITIVGVSIAVLLSVFVFPSIVLSPTVTLLFKDHITFQTLVGFACILSGTANKPIVILFLTLLIFGQILLLRKLRLLSVIFIVIIVLCFIALVVSGRSGINTPVVISRYMIPVFPFGYLLVALGIDSILRNFRSSKLMKSLKYGGVLTNLIPAVWVLLLFFGGPLISIYTRPNNFTNHPAFYESYEPITWEQAYTSDEEPGVGIEKKDMPNFYQDLSIEPDDTVIIEYPMEIGGDYNFYYYYQHFHKKTVIVGYITRPDIMDYIFKQKAPDTELNMFATAGFYADLALCNINDTSKLSFKNMVDMMNIDAIRKSRANYIILHKNLRVEMNPFLFGNNTPVYKPVIILSHNYTEFFGPAVYEDEDIIVFRVNSK